MFIVKAFWRVLLVVKMSHSFLGIIWTTAQLNKINIARYCIKSYIKVVTLSVGISSAPEPSNRSLNLFHNVFVAFNFVTFLRGTTVTTASETSMVTTEESPGARCLTVQCRFCSCHFVCCIQKKIGFVL